MTALFSTLTPSSPMYTSNSPPDLPATITVVSRGDRQAPCDDHGRSTRFVAVCRGMSRYVAVCLGTSRYGAVRRGMSRYVAVCRGLSRYVARASLATPAYNSARLPTQRTQKLDPYWRYSRDSHVSDNFSEGPGTSENRSCLRGSRDSGHLLPSVKCHFVNTHSKEFLERPTKTPDHKDPQRSTKAHEGSRRVTKVH